MFAGSLIQSANGQPANTNSFLFNHNDAAVEKWFFNGGKIGEQQLQLQRRSFRSSSKQNEGRFRIFPQCKYAPEIRVRRDDDPSFLRSSRKNFLVG
jgi:hypothetical protein